MSLIGRLVARLGIDCGLPAAGIQRAWLAAEPAAERRAYTMADAFKLADEDCDCKPPYRCVCDDFPAGVESTPAPPAGACRHCSLPSWVVHCPNGVTQAMCQHHGFISTERK